MKTTDYKSLRAELDQIIDSLGQDEPDIDKAMKNYERGMEIIKQLEQYIGDAKNKVTKLKAQFDTE